MTRTNVLAAILCWFLAAAISSPALSCNTSKAGKSKSNNNMTKTESDEKSATMGDQISGMWGGDHISLDVNDSGAKVDYDCAHGTITEKLVPDRNGKLLVKGFYVREHAGPIREGEEDGGEPAVYSASLSGQTMTLTVTLSRTSETVGPFTLTHGKMGRLRKCG